MSVFAESIIKNIEEVIDKHGDREISDRQALHEITLLLVIYEIHK